MQVTVRLDTNEATLGYVERSDDVRFHAGETVRLSAGTLGGKTHVVLQGGPWSALVNALREEAAIPGGRRLTLNLLA